eukprot:NODE_6317_length_459_cov_106.236585_g4796_i0.p2 GENE.NODE_6317_length_459_cov_106.236585_g4796_i0~~NODE_6317_length_459_cov_106.236585_g4796_i0.p2  ORF type:complete len:93 (+),score=15.86 NODE_6317_length_459_cov_106.236585_g4796_i0:179-457(+)
MDGHTRYGPANRQTKTTTCTHTGTRARALQHVNEKEALHPNDDDDPVSRQRHLVAFAAAAPWVRVRERSSAALGKGGSDVKSYLTAPPCTLR